MLSLWSAVSAPRRTTIVSKGTGFFNSGSPLGLQPSQQQPRQFSGAMYGLSFAHAPPAAWNHLSRPRGISFRGGTTISWAIDAQDAFAHAAGVMGKGKPIATVGIVGLEFTVE